MKNSIFLILILCIIIIFISPIMAVNSYISENEDFNPVYSENLTAVISPEKPAEIITDIRDSETAFFRIYAWGNDPNTTDFDIWTTPGNVSIPGAAPFNSSTSGYPEVITVTNKSSEYLQVNPGEYTTLVSSSKGNGTAEIHFQYIYHPEIDMGSIADNDYSVWETTIPPGLSRVIFITESVRGTDLDLFIQKGTSLPDSFQGFDYISASNCTQCWDTGIENWVAEMLTIDSPEPGPYLMVTSAHGGDDFFMTYWMGVENENRSASGYARNQTPGRSNKSDVIDKYAKTPFRIRYPGSNKEEDWTNISVPHKAYI